MGDFNINLLNVDTHVDTSEFLEMMYSFSYLPLITKPTRVTKSSATLIDNIFSNFNPNNEGIAGICTTDISDHFPVFYIDLHTACTPAFDRIIKRSYCTANEVKFREAISEVNWDEVLKRHDTQESFSAFHMIFKERYDKSFPLQSSDSKYRNRLKWLTAGLKKSIKIKKTSFMLKA